MSAAAEWVSVKRGLPSIDKFVLVRTTESHPAKPHFQVAAYEPDFEGACWRAECDALGVWYLHEREVTHWKVIEE